MIKGLALLAIASTLFLYSCSPSREEMLNEISKMETTMKETQKVDSVAVTELISAYQNFASKYTDDSLAPENLYKAAGLAVGFGRGVQAVELYETIITKYPDYNKVAECFLWKHLLTKM
jgi:hypothetical protein